MESRKRFFIGIGIAAGIIVVAFLAYRALAPGFKAAPAKKPIQTSNFATVTTTGKTPTIDPALNVQRTPGVVDGIYLRQLARMVVEWSGSYSNQNNNSHIDAVSPFVTSKFLTFLKSRAPQTSDEYAGRTTHVIVSSLAQKKDAEATITVGVQESAGDVASTSTYRTGSVHIVNDSGTWKVDGIFWDK